jgi:hypothetical protein
MRPLVEIDPLSTASGPSSTGPVGTDTARLYDTKPAPKPRRESSAQKMRRFRSKEDLITTISEDLVDAGVLKENDVEDFDAIKRAMREVLETLHDVTAKNAV